jgi:hypothetical protein
MPWSGTLRTFSVRRDDPRKPTYRKVSSNGADLASASSASVAPAMYPRRCESGWTQAPTGTETALFTHIVERLYGKVS